MNATGSRRIIAVVPLAWEYTKAYSPIRKTLKVEDVSLRRADNDLDVVKALNIFFRKLTNVHGSQHKKIGWHIVVLYM